MPFCEHARNPDIRGVFASLYNVRLIEHIYSWVWLSQLDPKADATDHLGKVCSNECPMFDFLEFLKHESLHFHSHTHEVL